jgi:hypothetical protein
MLVIPPRFSVQLDPHFKRSSNPFESTASLPDRNYRGSPTFHQPTNVPSTVHIDSPYHTFGYDAQQATKHSTIFEDNKGCVDLIVAPTMHPRSHCIAIKYHHFQENVEKGHIRICWISSKHQLADKFTKPLPAPKFTRQQLFE